MKKTAKALAYIFALGMVLNSTRAINTELAMVNIIMGVSLYFITKMILNEK